MHLLSIRDIQSCHIARISSNDVFVDAVWCHHGCFIVIHFALHAFVSFLIVFVFIIFMSSPLCLDFLVVVLRLALDLSSAHLLLLLPILINSCDNLLRLCRCSESFVLQTLHVIHDVTSVRRAPRHLRLTTKNVVPESLELLALQWLRRKSPTMLSVPQCSICAFPFST
jgi:hypothetical protein